MKWRDRQRILASLTGGGLAGLSGSALEALREALAASSEAPAAPTKRRPGQETLTFPVIGRIRTVFPTRNGTPRQSLLVHEARAVLALDQALGLNGADAFGGLEGECSTNCDRVVTETLTVI